MSDKFVEEFEISPDRVRKQCEDILCDGGKVVWAEETGKETTVVIAEFPKGPIALFGTIEMLANDDVYMSQQSPM